MNKFIFKFLLPVVVSFWSERSVCRGARWQVSGTLTFMSWYNQGDMQPLLDAFTAQYPDVKIDFQNVPAANNQYTQRLQLLASSGELPDLFYIQPPITLFAKNGYMADISDLDSRASAARWLHAVLYL